MFDEDEPQDDPIPVVLPMVWVERETFGGDVERAFVPAPVAVWMVLHDDRLGSVYRRGIILWGDVVDLWSGSA